MWLSASKIGISRLRDKTASSRGQDNRLPNFSNETTMNFQWEEHKVFPEVLSNISRKGIYHPYHAKNTELNVIILGCRTSCMGPENFEYLCSDLRTRKSLQIRHLYNESETILRQL
jgi:hypothetical protein